MKRNKTFVYDGRTLEVVAIFNQGEWRVNVLEGGKPANQVGYSVSGLTDLDAKLAKDVDCVGSLMEVAERDFIASTDWLKRNRASERATS